jgi:hypothetical protein
MLAVGDCRLGISERSGLRSAEGREALLSRRAGRRKTEWTGFVGGGGGLGGDKKGERKRERVNVVEGVVVCKLRTDGLIAQRVGVGFEAACAPPLPAAAPGG